MTGVDVGRLNKALSKDNVSLDPSPRGAPVVGKPKLVGCWREKTGMAIRFNTDGSFCSCMVQVWLRFDVTSDQLLSNDCTSQYMLRQNSPANFTLVFKGDDTVSAVCSFVNEALHFHIHNDALIFESMSHVSLPDSFRVGRWREIIRVYTGTTKDIGLYR